jgi:hypothetical protein
MPSASSSAKPAAPGAPLPVPRPSVPASPISPTAAAIANQLVALYHSAHSERDRELILETATELRLILMQPGLD